jgi:hypothetical protein
MKPTLYAAVLMLFGLITSCSSVNVQQKPGVDFSKYRTFDWGKMDVKSANSQNPIYQSSLNDQMIQDAISSELAKRGLRRVQGNTKPDLYLAYHLYIEEAERTVANQPAAGFAYPYAFSYRGAFFPVNYGYMYGSPFYSTGYHTENYKEGTLILDFIDSRSRNLVWRGSVADAVNNPANIGSEFAKSAKEILDKFPVEKQ